MRKIIIAFAAGQVLQLSLLGVALTMTYANDTLWFCIIGGLITTVILGVGVILDRIELAVKEKDMEETAALPEEVKVTNDRIEKDPPTPPKTGSNADHSKEGKRIRLALEGEHSTLMEETLKEATK